MKSRKKNQTILWILLFATLFRLFLFWKIPVVYQTEQIYDDQLMYNYAVNIANFKWLGEYTHTTLIKSISYPLFIAVCHWLSIPYSLGLGLLCIVSAYVFVRAVDKLIPLFMEKAIIYILMIYSPAGFDFFIAQRTYQLSVVPYAVILVFSCMIAVYLRRNEGNFIIWSIGGAICLPFFYYIRDDSVWIMPFVIMVILVTIGSIIYKNRSISKELIKKGLLIMLPIFSLALVTFGICIINYIYYDEFVTSERTNSEFAELMNLLYVIEDDEASLDVWCSNDAIKKAIDVSPTFKTIEKEILTQEYNWSGGTFDDMHGDMSMWVVRCALNEAGYFDSAPMMNEFCAQVSEELNLAFKNGTLKKDNLIHLKSVQVQEQYIKNGKYFKDFVEYFKGIAAYKCTIPKVSETGLSTGDVYSIRCWESFFNNFTVYPDIDNGTGTVVRDPNSFSNHTIEKIINMIFFIFQFLSPFVSIIAFVGFIFITLFLFYDRRHYEMWLIILGITLSAILHIIMVVLFTSWFEKEMQPFVYMYLAGAYPLVQIAKYLSIYQSVSIVTKISSHHILFQRKNSQ